MGTMHELAVMGTDGDTKHTWNADNEIEVATAREAFESLRSKGYLIYNVGRDDAKGEVMHRFDASAEKMIATPKIVGG